MSKYELTKGHVFEQEFDPSTAGIHVIENGLLHGNRIEAYGDSLKDAEALRDFILEAIAKAEKLQAELDETNQLVAALQDEVERLQEANAELREQSRGRKWPEEKPEAGVPVLVVGPFADPVTGVIKQSDGRWYAYESEDWITGVRAWLPIPGAPEDKT